MRNATFPPLIRTLAVTFGICLLGASTAHAKCVSPSYVVGVVWQDTDSTLAASISMALDEFRPSRLICLGAELHRRYKPRSSIQILVFSSSDAAARFHIIPGDPAPGTSLTGPGGFYWIHSQLHAWYVYDAVRGVEYIRLKPLGGLEDLPEDTLIHLPTDDVPSCRLRAGKRCILAMSPVTYPVPAFKQALGGVVVFTADVNGQGVVSNVRVKTSRGSDGPAAALLVRESADNLRSWRFASAWRGTTITVTYEYIIDRTMPRGSTRVTLESDGKYVVRGNPG